MHTQMFICSVINDDVVQQTTEAVCVWCLWLLVLYASVDTQCAKAHTCTMSRDADDADCVCFHTTYNMS